MQITLNKKDCCLERNLKERYVQTKVTVQLLMHISCEQGVVYDVQTEKYTILKRKERLNVKSFLPY